MISSNLSFKLYNKLIKYRRNCVNHTTKIKIRKIKINEKIYNLNN